jgi:SAM-dependent methyltransferase
MTDASEWQGRVGANWAAQWRRTDRSFAPLTERLLQRSREFAFASVLDVGCGAGELSLALARGRPNCRVVGVDISPHLVAAAEARGANLANAAFEVGDAAVWQPEAGFVPELLVSRHGVMFFDDAGAAFTHLAGIAAPGAGLMFSCFRDVAQNPLFSEVSRLLPAAPQGDPHAPGPFAFADPAHVEALLGSAGWHGVDFEPFDLAMVVGAGAEPVEDALAYFSSIGPAARAAADMPPEQVERLHDGLRNLARRHELDGMVALRAATWIVTAHRG